MPQAAWEAMLADALRPEGVHPRNLPSPQGQPYVLRRLPEALQETRREGRRLWDITPSPTPRTHTPPRNPGSVDAPTPAAPAAPQEPCAPHSTTCLTPNQRRHQLTPIPSQPPPRGATLSPVQKTPSEPEAKGRQRARQRALLRPTAPTPRPQQSKRPNPAKAPTRVKPEPHPVTSYP